ncbi:MAG: MtrB/PioB family outer membrane beta-barrel protein [Proteobacteria bacterium]|nr:MtrB/PioB family outer membrane beta-barrel protein [Pseudomonadota bacterium]
MRLPMHRNVGAEYAFSVSTTNYDFASGTALTSAPLPAVKSTLNSLGLFAKYNLNKAMTAKVGYRYEQYSTNDFALDNVDVNRLANVITWGNDSPDYVVHFVGATFAVRF